MSDNPFSTNPYSSPSAASEHYLPPDFSALDSIRGPATGLMVVSIVWLVIICASLLIKVVMTTLILTGNIQGPQPNPNPNVGPAEMLTFVPGIIGGVLQLGLHGVVLFGALQMRKLRNIWPCLHRRHHLLHPLLQRLLHHRHSVWHLGAGDAE
jgi:hypothetical protein